MTLLGPNIPLFIPGSKHILSEVPVLCVRGIAGPAQARSATVLTLALPQDAAPGQLWLVAQASTCPVPVWAHIGGGGIQLGAAWGGQCPTASMEAMMGKGSG